MHRFQTADIGPRQEGQCAEDRRAASAQITLDALDALDVPLYHPVTPSAFTDQVLGIQTWISGQPESRNVGLKAG